MLDIRKKAELEQIILNSNFPIDLFELINANYNYLDIMFIEHALYLPWNELEKYEKDYYNLSEKNKTALLYDISYQYNVTILVLIKRFTEINLEKGIIEGNSKCNLNQNTDRHKELDDYFREISISRKCYLEDVLTKTNTFFVCIDNLSRDEFSYFDFLYFMHAIYFPISDFNDEKRDIFSYNAGNDIISMRLKEVKQIKNFNKSLK